VAVPPPLIGDPGVLVRDDRVYFELHQPLRVDEARHLHEGAGRSHLGKSLRMRAGGLPPLADVGEHYPGPVRSWPADAKPFDPLAFQEEYRHVLRLLARAGKALEVNTTVPLHPQILDWWREDGGQAISFASDTHSPDRLAAGFAGAVRVADAAGFGAGKDPLGLWYRT